MTDVNDKPKASAKRMILEFIRKSMNSNGVKVDVNCQELRTIIPTIIQQLVYNGDCSVTKVRGKYSHRPDGWNVAVPFVDPNNKPKPGKEVLIEMTHELIRLFRIQQQQRFGDQTAFQEILDHMSGPYSVERLESLVPRLLTAISEQRQDPYKNSLTEAFEDWKKGSKIDSGPNNSEIDVRDVQQMSDEMDYSPGTSSSGLQNTATMEDRVDIKTLQGHINNEMEVRQHNTTTTEYRSNIRIADCVKSLDINFDRENICDLKRDDDDDEHIPPRPKKQKLDRRATSTIKLEQMSSMEDAPESQPHDLYTSIGSSYQLPLVVETINDQIDADDRTDINRANAIEPSVIFGGAAARTSTTEATFNFSELPQLSLWDDLPELSFDYVDNFLSRSLERTDP